MSARSAGPGDAVEQRLAGIHLRLGSLSLARAELEELAAADSLDVMGLADLAEVRWRTGDLDPASAAALAHLAAGGVEPIALIIAAEAAAVAGRPAEARTHVAALDALTAAELERHFAGMPRRAFWPSGPAAAMVELEESGSGRGREGRRATPPGRQVGDAPGARDAAPGPGLWPDDDGPVGGVRGVAAVPSRGTPGTAAAEAVPADLLTRGRADIQAGDADRLATGLDRLAIALRLDPTLAAGVLEALARRHEPGALVLRGDACRILGRVLEAEAAYSAAAAALDPGALDRADRS